jgi:hypothetical protein
MNFFKTLSLLILLVFVAASCSKNKLQVAIQSIEELNNVPSGSGMAQVGDTLYIVGDDSPFLYGLDSSNNTVFKFPLSDTSNFSDGRVAKKLKLDFEAMEKISDKEIIIFGSGSKSPTRDIMILVKLEDSIRFENFRITNFYDNLRQLPEMKGHKLNIEAAVYWNGNLSLFNRTNNLIFTYRYNDFINSIRYNQIPHLNDLIKVNLPKINGIQSGFSGGEGLEDNNLILFTASVEGTKSTYHDGEIFGSFIGILRIENNKIKFKDEIIQIPSDEPNKVESVTKVKSLSKNKFEIWMITDNDDGKSNLIEAILTY